MLLININNDIMLLNDYRELHTLTFTPATNYNIVTNFKIKGKTYNERKNNLIDIAIELQNTLSSFDISYNKLFIIGNFLEKNAKRYGLMEEFKENGII